MSVTSSPSNSGDDPHHNNNDSPTHAKDATLLPVFPACKPISSKGNDDNDSQRTSNETNHCKPLPGALTQRLDGGHDRRGNHDEDADENDDDGYASDVATWAGCYNRGGQSNLITTHHRDDCAKTCATINEKDKDEGYSSESTQVTSNTTASSRTGTSSSTNSKRKFHPQTRKKKMLPIRRTSSGAKMNSSSATTSRRLLIRRNTRMNQRRTRWTYGSKPQEEAAGPNK